MVSARWAGARDRPSGDARSHAEEGPLKHRTLRSNPQTPQTHSLEGILVVVGGPFGRGVTGAEASIYDIAPTVLHLLGFPVPTGLSGRVLTELMDQEFVARFPVRREPWDGSPTRGKRGPGEPGD